MDRIKRIVCI